MTQTCPRVAYVAHWFPKPSETFVYDEVCGLREAGCPVCVYTLYGPLRKGLSPDMAAYPGRVYRMGMPAAGRFAGMVRLWRRRKPEVTRELLRTVPRRRWSDPEAMGENLWAFFCGFQLAHRFETELIDHIHAAWANGPATAAWVASRLTSIPFSFSAHATDIYPPDGALAEKIAAASFVRSENLANIEHMKDYAADPAKFVMIHSGHRGDTAPRQRSPEPPYTLAAVGRLVRKKGFDVLIDAAAMLARRGLDVRLRIAGSGWLERKLRKQVSRLGLADRVEFAGFISRDEVDTFMQEADALVVPSVVDPTGDRDGIPNVIIEAFLRGLPVVATDSGAIAEAVRDGETGRLVQPNHPERLADAIEKALSDREESNRMAAGARELAEREFALDRTCQALLDLFVEHRLAARGGAHGDG